MNESPFLPHSRDWGLFIQSLRHRRVSRIARRDPHSDRAMLNGEDHPVECDTTYVLLCALGHTLSEL